MTNKINFNDWSENNGNKFLEFDIPAAGGQPDSMQMGPTSSPGGPGNPMADPTQGGGPLDDPGPGDGHTPEDDISDDPESPDMPDDFNNDGEADFEIWKKQYFEESVKGDPDIMLKMLKQVRDRELEPSQRKFVEDNIQIQYLRQHANVFKVSDEARKLLKKQLDHNNPATSVVEHLTMVVQKDIYINEVFIRLNGLTGTKGDYHRKFIAALLGAVQVSSDTSKAGIIMNESDYSIMLSTRYNSEWGEVNLGKWSLKEDDPERYLEEPEIRKLEEGSPEEKDVLRRRVVMESIAERYKQRAFIVNVTATDGTIYWLGWDIYTCLKAAYTEGKLVIRTRHSDNSEAMIDDDGNIVPFLDLSIYYTQDTGKLDADGKPDTEELEFLERRDGMLFLTANMNTTKNAATALQGMNFKEIPYAGNPSDVPNIQRNVPSAVEVLMRQQ